MIVIRANVLLRPEHLQEAANNFRKQAETGIIILPPYFELAGVLDGEGIMVVRQGTPIGEAVAEVARAALGREPLAELEKVSQFVAGYEDEQAEGGLTSED